MPKQAGEYSFMDKFYEKTNRRGQSLSDLLSQSRMDILREPSLISVEPAMDRFAHLSERGRQIKNIDPTTLEGYRRKIADLGEIIIEIDGGSGQQNLQDTEFFKDDDHSLIASSHRSALSIAPAASVLAMKGSRLCASGIVKAVIRYNFKEEVVLMPAILAPKEAQKESGITYNSDWAFRKKLLEIPYEKENDIEALRKLEIKSFSSFQSDIEFYYTNNGAQLKLPDGTLIRGAEAEKMIRELGLALQIAHELLVSAIRSEFVELAREMRSAIKELEDKLFLLERQ